MVKRIKISHCAKFHGDRSNHCLDVVLSRFFKMMATAILDF